MMDYSTLMITGGKSDDNRVLDFACSVRIDTGAITQTHSHMIFARMNHGIYRILNWVYVFGGRAKNQHRETVDI
jgi:hypothetical protein